MGAVVLVDDGDKSVPGPRCVRHYSCVRVRGHLEAVCSIIEAVTSGLVIL